ncbi:hypothetical protein SDC9_131030 [bioreactor metagenome]|uniref:Uncharacterized protein n=1 Tax=bioreactor metagenome TaxID=1076179 RepID=A0A645D394_9ZZZZ
MFEVNPAHPAVFGILDGNSHPGMVFIFGILFVVIGHHREVLHTGMSNSTRPPVTNHLSFTKGSIQRHGKRHIHR